MDVWKDVPGFVGYQVSHRGLVWSERTGCLLKPSANQRGIYQVGMMKDGIQRKVSVALLVAKAFLAKPRDDRFNTIVHLDGDRDHNFVENLVWRPDGFARDYRRQFAQPYPNRLFGEIVLLQTDEVFYNSWRPAMKYGLLERAVVLSATNEGMPTFPTNHLFKLVRQTDASRFV